MSSKRSASTVLLLLCSIVSLGCAARINKMMATWEGQPVTELVAKWGPPTSVVDDGNGGKILTYTTFVTTYHEPAKSQTTGRVDPNGNVNVTTTHTPEQTSGYNRQRVFFVNSRGIVYRWSWRGL